MSSRITFIDNKIDSGDWFVVILNGEVIYERHVTHKDMGSLSSLKNIKESQKLLNTLE